MSQLFEARRGLLDGARSAMAARTWWSAFSEVPRTYGDELPAQGAAAFQALGQRPFLLPGHPEAQRVGSERSPFGPALGIDYPTADVSTLIAASRAAQGAWAAAPLETRTGIALEIVARLNRLSFLMAHAVEHTTGQAFAMAFQAGGPHAQDRGLEAIAYAWDEVSRVPGPARWEKAIGRTTVCLDKQFHVVPRGIGLVIACATFPTWNSYPAIFADLVTGNTVIVKPHPAVVLPLALTVRTAREVLQEEGFDPNVVLLAADTVDAPLAADLATDPGVGIVDFTGSSAFGGWLREHARDKPVFTEESGVNTVVISGAPSFAGMCQNLAFSLSLYSGQMCTTPQSVFVPRGGIETDEGHKSFDDVAAGLAGAIDTLLSDPARASAVLGAVQNPATLERIARARALGRVVRDSVPLPGEARTATPLLIAVDEADEDAYAEEWFGPISFVIAADSADDAIVRAAAVARRRGAITAALYTDDESLITRATAASTQAGVALSINLTGPIYVNQSAAFSDYHVSGANPAGNASLTDAAFIAGRFRIVGVRRPAAASSTQEPS